MVWCGVVCEYVVFYGVLLCIALLYVMVSYVCVLCRRVVVRGMVCYFALWHMGSVCVGCVMGGDVVCVCFVFCLACFFFCFFGLFCCVI